MDWAGNWYQMVAVYTFILSAGVAWEVLRLKKHLHMEGLMPTKKWKKAVRGPKYVPNHKPIQMSEYGDEDDLRFYRDFSRVADYLNELYNDEPWSFENTGRGDIANYGSENGTEFEIQIRYNQQITGEIRMSCIHYLADRPHNIRVELNLTNSRIFNSYRVFGLAKSVSEVVSDEERFQETEIKILAAMNECVWQIGEEANGNPDLEISFRGRAEWFLKHHAYSSRT